MNNVIRVGVIGCGWAGEQHARAYSSIENAQLLSVADIDIEKARNLAVRWGSVCHRDYRKVLRDPEIDAVSICLPHYLHCKVSVEAAEADKHVLCEKPMANSLNEADKMITAAEKAGVTLMIAENVRFHPINIKLKELINQNLIGEIFLARIFRDHKMHDSLRRRPWFLDKKKAGGGIWMAGGIHDVDALRMLVGEIETIALFQAKSMFPEMQGDDTMAALLRFAGGPVGVVTESFSTKTRRPLSPHGCPSILNASKGTITVTSDEIEVYRETSGTADACLRMKVEEGDTFLEEIRYFLNCIRNRESPVTSGEEERRTLAVICAGYESLRREGSPVKVKY